MRLTAQFKQMSRFIVNRFQKLKTKFVVTSVSSHNAINNSTRVQEHICNTKLTAFSIFYTISWTHC